MRDVSHRKQMTDFRRLEQELDQTMSKLKAARGPAQHRSETMARENIVLSLNPDGQKLHGEESVLRENGFGIISAATPLRARFEIEVVTCGIFLTSYITPSAMYRDLANLFRRSLAKRFGHLPDGASR
jgi:hypothetical protein